MNDDAQTVGALYSPEKDMTLRVHDTGYIVTSGPVISPDVRRLYHTDSVARTVYAFDLSADGMLSNKCPFIQFPEGLYPDGMAVDETGNLWIAVFNGWRIEKYSPLRKKLSEIRLPCANVTKPAFRGDDLRTLYVTTARIGLTPESRAKQPLAGRLFAVNLEVPGLKSVQRTLVRHFRLRFGSEDSYRGFTGQGGNSAGPVLALEIDRRWLLRGRLCRCQRNPHPAGARGQFQKSRQVRQLLNL